MITKKSYFKFSSARFHVDTGPDSLFTRVRFKMKDVTNLRIDGKHFSLRRIERNIPDELIRKIQMFSKDEWTVKTAEVRIDSGKFINSTWETIYEGQRYWITIGWAQLVETVISKTSSGKCGITTSGELYKFVEKVNADLMMQEEVQVESVEMQQ